MSYCTQCGAKLATNANFCASCGQSLDLPGDDDATTVPQSVKAAPSSSIFRAGFSRLLAWTLDSIAGLAIFLVVGYSVASIVGGIENDGTFSMTGGAAVFTIAAALIVFLIYLGKRERHRGKKHFRTWHGRGTNPVDYDSVDMD